MRKRVYEEAKKSSIDVLIPPTSQPDLHSIRLSRPVLFCLTVAYSEEKPRRCSLAAGPRWLRQSAGPSIASAVPVVPAVLRTRLTKAFPFPFVHQKNGNFGALFGIQLDDFKNVQIRFFSAG